MINKKWLTEIGFEAGFQIIQPQLPILPQVSSGNQEVLGPNPASFTATVPGGITGQPTTITIQARDSTGQSVVVGGNAVFVSVTGSNSASGAATDNNNGTYTFTYIPTVAGADQIAITADGIAITGSPYTSTVSAATQITKQQILTYLQSLPAKTSNKLLVASQASTWNHNTPPWLDSNPKPAGYGQVMDPINQLFAQTGKYPAVFGQEFDNSPGNPNYTTTPQTTYAIQWAQTGGLNMVLYEWNNPWTGGNPFDTTITTTFADVLTPGTAAYTAFMAQTAALGDQLAILQAAGVVVILVPMSEMNGNWFWWGSGITNGPTAAQYKALYQQVYNYIVTTRGLTNVIWCYITYAASPNTVAFYPGASFIDLVGFDYFGHNAPVTGLPVWTYPTVATPAYTALLTLNKPVICAQVGPFADMTTFSEPNTFDYMTLINDIRNNTPNVCLFLAWDGQDRLDVQNNSVGVMTDPWVIDRSEVSISVVTPTLIFNTQPSSSPVAGQPFGTNPVIQLTDGAGHNIASGGVQIVLSPSSAGISFAITPNPLLTDSTGKATVTSITPTGAAGTYSMIAAATGYASATSTPFTVSPGTINPGHCTANVPSGTINVVCSIVIQARDTWDNALTVGGATIAVTVSGANSASGAAIDNADGTYTFNFTPTALGTDAIAITANGTAINGSPFTQSVTNPSILYPNEPAGFVHPTGFDRSFNADPEGVWTFSSTHSTIRNASTYSPGGGVAAPINPPASPSLIGEAAYSANFTQGTAPMWDYIPNATFASLNLNWTRIYVAWFVQFSSNWVNHPSGTNKIGFMYLPSGAPIFIIKNLNGVYDIGLQGLPSGLNSGHTGVEFPGTTGPANVTFGLWQRVEYVLTMNTPGVANGRIDGMWITNYNSSGHVASGPTQVLSPSSLSQQGTSAGSIAFVDAGVTGNWAGIAWQPVWGGNAPGATPGVQMYMWMDQIRVSGHS